MNFSFKDQALLTQWIVVNTLSTGTWVTITHKNCTYILVLINIKIVFQSISLSTSGDGKVGFLAQSIATLSMTSKSTSLWWRCLTTCPPCLHCWPISSPTLWWQWWPRGANHPEYSLQAGQNLTTQIVILATLPVSLPLLANSLPTTENFKCVDRKYMPLFILFKHHFNYSNFNHGCVGRKLGALCPLLAS